MVLVGSCSSFLGKEAQISQELDDKIVKMKLLGITLALDLEHLDSVAAGFPQEK